MLQQNSKNVEAIFSYGQLLQKMVKYGCENRAFRDRAWSNFVFSLIASTSQDKIGSIGLDLPPFASAPGYPYYLQSRTCGYNHELFPVVFINVEISTFHFLTLWKSAEIWSFWAEIERNSYVLPGFHCYFHKLLFPIFSKPLVHKGSQYLLDILSIFSWLYAVKQWLSAVKQCLYVASQWLSAAKPCPYATHSYTDVEAIAVFNYLLQHP